MERVKQKDLEILCGILNKITSSPTEQFTKAEGKLKANVGNFHLSWAYGGVCLHRMHSIGGSVTCPLGQDHIGKKELYYKMQSFISGLEYQKNGT